MPHLFNESDAAQQDTDRLIKPLHVGPKVPAASFPNLLRAMLHWDCQTAENKFNESV